MTASELVEKLTARGFSLSVVGDKLRYKPTPDPATLEEMRQHKAEIISSLVAQGTHGANERRKYDDDQAELFEERAAIMEFSGNLTRDQAERLALLEYPKGGLAT